MYMVDVSSYPGIAITNPIDGGSYPVKAGSFPVNAGSYPLRCRSRCPCIATSHPDAFPVHYPIDGKSTLHQRKIHHPSTGYDPAGTGNEPKFTGYEPPSTGLVMAMPGYEEPSSGHEFSVDGPSAAIEGVGGGDAG